MLSAQDPHTDALKIILMCLFHDLHEARTGDQNYVNKQYVKVDEDRSIRDLARNLPFGDAVIALTQEFRKGESIDARLARDADQLDLILELKEQQDLGNRYAKEWIEYAIQRLGSESAKRMAREILDTDCNEWWFEKRASLWVNNPSEEG
jgi:putative hydrolase of HD superfamily